MNYVLSEREFPSSDGIHTIHAHLYLPTAGKPRAVIQLAHGMIDYVARYTDLADYLTGLGYLFAGHEHLGHGASAGNAEDLGFFARSGGADLVIEDMHQMNRLLREAYPDLPLIVMGHSMGSFITRLYVQKYPHTMSGVIIHGTGGPNPLLPFGRALSAMTEWIRGPKYRSAFLTKLAFGSYNKHFDRAEGESAWLTRDPSRVSTRDTDPYTNFIFTASGYRDLFRFVGRSNARRWFREYPKGMPTLIISGEEDPVGNYGRGPAYVYRRLLEEKCTAVEMKLYPGARHELFNETCRDEVFEDIACWIGGVLG